MNRKWSEKSTVEKVAEVISWIALVIWIVFEAVDRKIEASWASVGACTAIVVVCAAEAISFWKVKRVFSYIAIGGAVLLATVAVLLAL